jgi:glycosyltransferase involved in cell wall biosynthesis/predicted O-methyltransferase YrrM
LKKQRPNKGDSDAVAAMALERDELAPIFRRSMFWTPERQAPSAWTEHVPFAFWLVDALRPSTIVELGTHYGVSYSAMCQAVKSLSLPTRCYAVDTWKGDEHAGFYPDEVYRDFATFHDQHYSAFSRLVRSTFDEALPHFEDRSIDLLHIDGFHTYDAVRHDFESWLPKLSPNAIILFHDTNVRENNFGIFRLWNEIAPSRLHFNFLHGHGLGVLGLGHNYPNALCCFFDTNEDNRLVSSVREIFAYLGQSARLLCEHSALDRTLTEHEEKVAELDHLLTERNNEIARLVAERSEQDKQIASLGQAVAERDGQIANLGQAVAERDGQIANLGQTVAELDRQVTVQTNKLEEIFGSTVWRLLAPLRWYGRLRQWAGGSVGHHDIILEKLKPDFADQPLTPALSDGHHYRCSLVIPTKNGGDLFKQVVAGLRTQTCWKNVEFIIVDSGSTDDTISVARSAGAIVRTIPPNEFNHGATRDYAISLASNDYVVLMVQDAIPYDGFLIERLLDALNEEGVAGVYARQIPRSTANVIVKRNLNSWLTGGLERKVKAIESPDWYESLSPTEKYFFCNFDNVCSAINKVVWKEERFGRTDFGEDIVWAKRVLKRKFKIIYEPSAAVVHSHDRSLLYEYKRNYICHRLLYRQFGLQLVPSLRGLWLAWLGSSVSDVFFVGRKENRIGKKLRMLLTAPAANLLAAFGQYRAVQDEIRGIKRNVQDV